MPADCRPPVLARPRIDLQPAPIRAASFVLGPWSTLLAAALAGLFALLWFVLPLTHRIRHQHRPGRQDPGLQE
jgi:hypothetical protein